MNAIARFQRDMRKVSAQLDKIERRVLRGGLRSALNKAGTPILSSARNGAPVRTGALKKSLRKKVWNNQRKSKAGVIVGASTKATGIVVDGVEVRPSKYLHLVEYGTAAHGKHPGTPPSGFMRRTRTEATPRARAILAKEIGPAFKKAAARLQK